MRRIVILGALAVVFGLTQAGEPGQAGTLTFEERVAAQRAIEQVYWNHRIWPKENPLPKPPLESVMPETAIRDKVADYLQESSALEKWWHRPITAQQLQAEIDRMAANTQDPQTLQDLFDAVGDDPFVIAETLARQMLADRLIRSLYASDERFHWELKKKAETSLADCGRADCMKSMGGKYGETILKLRNGAGWQSVEKPETPSMLLEADEWREQLGRLARKLGGATGSLPLLVGPLEETDDAFLVTAALSQSTDTVEIAVVAWPKVSFDAWWVEERRTVAPAGALSASYTLPALTLSACANDTWARTSTGANVPGPTYGHTAVWTGTEMIVWGGYYTYSRGGRYFPSTDTWQATSTGANVPDPRTYHRAVWTGTEMIVWGGEGYYYGDLPLNTGGRYDPATDWWTATSIGPNVPSPRGGGGEVEQSSFTAVWTGTEMIIYGGIFVPGAPGFDGVMNSGGRYNPSTDTWTATSTNNEDALTGRYDHTAVWTGTEMIVWGGSGGSLGNRYNPSTDTWTAISTGANVPYSRGHTAVWTGTEMVLWGGYVGSLYFGGSPVLTGGCYNPTTDAWTTTSTGANVPAPRYGHSAVWTGAEMIVWGGYSPSFTNTGGRYDPVANRWAPTSTGANIPSPRSYHTAVWTGTEMIVWGGWNPSMTNTGGRYCACPTLYYRDADGDGHGDPGIYSRSCEGSSPAGYVADGTDCDDAAPDLWDTPGEALNLVFTDVRTLGWSAPVALGGTAVVYDLLRSTNPWDFVTFTAICVESNDGPNTVAVDAANPTLGACFYYHVRAENTCPYGFGILGTDSDNVPVIGHWCPY
jgi:hypothetical protein